MWSGDERSYQVRASYVLRLLIEELTKINSNSTNHPTSHWRKHSNL
jgi:hypothetical protein